MAIIPRVRKQHIAVFGESGSGKTVLISSFYGPTQAASFKNDLWDLVAKDTGQGNRLYKNYLGMRENGAVPITDRFTNTAFEFTVKLRPGDEGSAQDRPFDQLHLVWHDYPGEWFEEDPGTEEERARRAETFRALLQSDVGVLLVDGQKLLDNAGEEERYLKSLLGNFGQAVGRMTEELGAEGKLTQFPRIWVLALSKSDLLPEWTVDTFRDVMILKVADEIERLRERIAKIIETPEALSIGEDFLLLSSARFRPAPADAKLNQQFDIDVRERVGLDLMLPIAALLPLERVVTWHQQLQIPLTALDRLADGAGAMGSVLTGARAIAFERILNRFTRGNRSANLATKSIPVVATALQSVGPRLKEFNEQARAKHDHLRATLTQFKLDLERGVDDRVLWLKR